MEREELNDIMIELGAAKLVDWCDDFISCDKDERIYHLLHILREHFVNEGIFDEMVRDSYANEVAVSYMSLFLEEIMKGDQDDV